LGLIAGIADSSLNLSSSTKLLLITGFCGGLSTFSAFSYESLQLMQDGKYFYFILYITLSVCLCLATTFGGLLLGIRI
jgi:CrcB protein